MCNNIFTGAYYSVLSRKTPCKECRRRKVSPRRIDLDEILLSLAAEGYTYIGGEYHNNRSRLDVICPNKHIITIAHISWKQKSCCPICARARQGKIKYDEMFIKNFLSDNGLTLLEKDKQTITVKCSEGHITKRKWFETFKHKRFCRICKINKPEREILSFLKELGVKKQHRVRGIIGKKEIDFYLPEYNLGIEFNGLFWHSDYVLKDKNYHKNKQNMCENRGINLITIWQNEWENKKEIVKSIIKSRLGISDTVLDGGMLTVLNSSFEEIKKFISKNALDVDNFAKDSMAVSLISKTGIEAVLSYSVVDTNITIYGFCTKLNTDIPNGFSKLLQHLENTLTPMSIAMTIDRRYATGSSLLANGFKKKTTSMKFKWTDFQDCYNAKEECGRYQHKIYDNGHVKYLKTINRGYSSET